MKQYSISKDKLRKIRHSVMYDINTYEPYPRPKDVWDNRGIEHIIGAVPVPIADCWMLLVKDWDGELEAYEDELKLEPNDSFWSNYGINITE